MSPARVECAGKPATRQVPLKRDSAGLPAHAEPRLQPCLPGRIPTLLALCSVVFLLTRALPAQAIGQGFELERAGQYDQAAAIYLATLRAEPTNLSALLGLEREALRSEEHTSELQSPCNLVCRLLLEKKKKDEYVA